MTKQPTIEADEKLREEVTSLLEMIAVKGIDNIPLGLLDEQVERYADQILTLFQTRIAEQRLHYQKLMEMEYDRGVKDGESGIAEAVKKERERIVQKMRILFWFDDDAKTAGAIVTGSVIYSEFATLTQEGGTR